VNEDTTLHIYLPSLLNSLCNFIYALLMILGPG